MLQHAVRALLSSSRIDTVFIVLAPGDAHFAKIEWGELSARVAPLYCGGSSRRESVRNGLIACSSVVESDDWMLVHDACAAVLAECRSRPPHRHIDPAELWLMRPTQAACWPFPWPTP